MQNVQDRLIKIKESTLNIVDLVNELRQENAHLRREIAQIKEQIQPETKDLSEKDIEEQKAWKSKIRQEVDACVDEIDHCITMFNK